MADRFSADRREGAVVSPLAADRILIGVCAGVWLVLVGMAVAAAVALAELNRGFSRSAGSQHTPGFLYAVIIVSALVIAGAIPVLLRARRTNQARSAGAGSAGTPVPRVSGEPIERERGYAAPTVTRDVGGTERTPTVGSAAALSDAERDRIWLRGAVSLLAVIGTALIAVAAATYLMAVGRYGLAWAGYSVAGIITATMPVLVWWQLRQTHRMLGG